MDSERNAPLLEDPRSTTTGSERQSGGSFGQQAKPLKLVAAISIVFFNVSGGPLGSEEIISSLGPVIGLGLVLVFSLVFSIPQAMITAELSTAFPSNGGYSIWVQAAFGTFWGIQESYWSWFSGVVDSALYPVLLYSTGQQLLSGDGVGRPQDQHQRATSPVPVARTTTTMAAGGCSGAACSIRAAAARWSTL